MSRSDHSSTWRAGDLLATWFGSGYLPWAPGTWGSFFALPFGAAILYLGGPIWLLASAAGLFLIGVPLASDYARRHGKSDPKAVVIDEAAGQWIAMAPFCLDPFSIALSFFAFRFFDIVKVWPANLVERQLPAGWGIMADDVVAGLYGALLTIAINYLIGLPICFLGI